MTDRLTICWPCFEDHREVRAAWTHGGNGYCTPCYTVWVLPHLRAKARDTDQWRRGMAMRLDAAIVRSGMSRGRVAEAASISPTKLSDYTRFDPSGSTPVRIPLKRLVLLCEALNVTPNYLLGWDEPPVVPLGNEPPAHA